MAEYIDREKLLEQIEEPMNWTDSEAELQEQADYQSYKNLIENALTEDVVPRSEVDKAKQDVAREIFEEIHKEIKCALDNNYNELNKHIVDKHFAEYISGKLHALRGIDDFIDELKKNYL